MASKAPDSTLSASSPPKFFAAACAIKSAPHMKMLKDRYQAGGERCMRRFDGIAQASQPK